MANALFTPNVLVETARRVAVRADDAYYHMGDIAVGDHWDVGPQNLPIESIVESIRTANAWVILKHVERQPEYAPALDDFVAFITSAMGERAAREMRNPEMLAIVSSPGRVTPFHFDAEINFLVQVHGSKDVWICDPADRSIITEEELELYYAGDLSAGKFKPGVEAKARHFRLEPGDAVHIPTHAAHWVKNGESVSVSLSLNLELPDSVHLTKYRARHYLRRLGVAPGSAAWIESGPAAAAVTWAGQKGAKHLSTLKQAALRLRRAEK